MKIRNRFLFLTLAVTTTAILGGTLIFSHMMRNIEEQDLHKRILTNNELIQRTLETPLWRLDVDQVRRVCSTFHSNAELTKIELLDVPDVITPQIYEHSDEFTRADQLIVHRIAIHHEDTLVGTLQLTYTTAHIERKLLGVRMIMVGVAVGVSILLTALFGRLSVSITAPIDRLIYALRRVDNGNYSDPLRMEGHGEFRALESYFNNMLSTLRSNEEQQRSFVQQIKNKNEELELAMRVR